MKLIYVLRNLIIYGMEFFSLYIYIYIYVTFNINKFYYISI